MIISWRFFLKFFFLVINVFVAHAMEDFSLPSVGLENGVVVPTSPPSVPVDALKEIFSGLASSSSGGGGESISYVILKGFAVYIPPLIIGGGVTYLGAIAVKMAVNKIKTSFQNLLDTERV